MNEMKKFSMRRLFKYRNHYDMIPVTVRILRNDGVGSVYDFLKRRNSRTKEKYTTLLARGARDADLPWSAGYVLHLFHFHHPWTHRGYVTYRSAGDELARLFVIGQNFWTLGRRDRAIYQLGRMIHLLQDVFIPHHAAGTAFRGHGKLEDWLDDRWKHYTVQDGGYYTWDKRAKDSTGDIHTLSSKNPYDWIDAGSHLSIEWHREYFHNGAAEVAAFPQLASRIIPQTLRYSAGFIKRFFVGLTL